MRDIDKQPLITIITVSYNSAKTIERTIQSVISQSYQNIEYIIIDGMSTDGTTDIIAKYNDDIYYWISEKDNGVYDAMNKALALSNGFAIGILNSDDWYESEAVYKVVEHMQSMPAVDIIHGLLRFIDLNGNADSIVGHYSSFLNRGMIEHPTCFIKKSIYNLVGDFDLKYKSAADYDWMLRAEAMGANFLLIPEVITNFRRGGLSDSDHGFLEELQIKKRNNKISSFKYSYWKLFTVLKRIIRP